MSMLHDTVNVCGRSVNTWVNSQAVAAATAVEKLGLTNSFALTRFLVMVSEQLHIFYLLRARDTPLTSV